MPVKRKLQKTRPPGAGDLTRALVKEWTNPKKSGQPLIVIEGGEGELIHIYVIWDKWGDLNQTERSEVIMDAVERLTGEHRLPADSMVTVAMGLTAQEARRMRIKLT